MGTLKAIQNTRTSTMHHLPGANQAPLPKAKPDQLLKGPVQELAKPNGWRSFFKNLSQLKAGINPGTLLVEFATGFLLGGTNMDSALCDAIDSHFASRLHESDLDFALADQYSLWQLRLSLEQTQSFGALSFDSQNPYQRLVALTLLAISHGEDWHSVTNSVQAAVAEFGDFPGGDLDQAQRVAQDILGIPLFYTEAYEAAMIELERQSAIESMRRNLKAMGWNDQMIDQQIESHFGINPLFGSNGLVDGVNQFIVLSSKESEEVDQTQENASDDPIEHEEPYQDIIDRVNAGDWRAIYELPHVNIKSGNQDINARDKAVVLTLFSLLRIDDPEIHRHVVSQIEYTFVKGDLTVNTVEDNLSHALRKKFVPNDPIWKSIFELLKNCALGKAKLELLFEDDPNKARKERILNYYRDDPRYITGFFHTTLFSLATYNPSGIYTDCPIYQGALNTIKTVVEQTDSDAKAKRYVGGIIDRYGYSHAGYNQDQHPYYMIASLNLEDKPEVDNKRNQYILWMLERVKGISDEEKMAIYRWQILGINDSDFQISEIRWSPETLKKSVVDYKKLLAKTGKRDLDLEALEESSEARRKMLNNELLTINEIGMLTIDEQQVVYRAMNISGAYPESTYKPNYFTDNKVPSSVAYQIAYREFLTKTGLNDPAFDEYEESMSKYLREISTKPSKPLIEEVPVDLPPKKPWWKFWE